MHDSPVGRTRVRVRYPETDRMDIAYHGHYLVWFEIGRTELMRDMGCDYGKLEREEEIYLPLRRVSASYRVSARYDDLLEIESRIVNLGGASVDFEYRIHRVDDNVLIATGATGHGAVNREGRPCRLPRWLRERLSARTR